MKIKDFAVERYFAKYEFSAQYMLSSSDCDGYSMDYVLSVASADEKNLWESLKLGYTETVGSEFLRKAIKGHYKTIQMDEIAFVGDDLPDLAVIRRVGLGITPANGSTANASDAHWQTDKRGGDGAVREVAEMILQAQGKLQSLVAEFL